MSAPAGWYPDPTDPARQRWWDGAGWGALAPKPDGAPAPQPYGAPAPAAPIRATNQDVRTGTAWIWVLVFLPLLTLPALFLIDWRTFIDAYVSWIAAMSLAPSAEMATGYVPFFVNWMLSLLGVTAIGWIAYGVAVVVAWLDSRELARRGLDHPFPWPWAFLSPAVYVIGRTVVVRRRTGAGLAPLWAWIGVQVVVVVSTFVFVAVIIDIALDAFSRLMLQYGMLR
ncbi:DUF2510 domain-containing protein [Microbacterium sp. NPDC089189]|uniref:DUF2510 domain-containing protein n=1 Tax=Microbacterium sp. NPDC089189 TaxID=3154972 RepID=UPI00343DAEF1